MMLYDLKTINPDPPAEVIDESSEGEPIANFLQGSVSPGAKARGATLYVKEMGERTHVEDSCISFCV